MKELAPIADAIRGALQEPVTDNGVALLPPGWTSQDLAEKLLSEPRRIERTIVARQLTDFTSAVGRFMTTVSVISVTADVAAVVSGKNALATCIFDYHAQHNDPQWCEFLAEYRPTMHPAYALLRALSGKFSPQDEFAAAMRRLRRYVTSMGAGELLELARELQITSNAEFQSLTDDRSGSVGIVYDVQVQASTKSKSVMIPEQIGFSMPMFLGEDPSNFVVDFRFRPPKSAGGQVQVGILIEDHEEQEFQAILGLADNLRALGLPTIIGEF